MVLASIETTLELWASALRDGKSRTRVDGADAVDGIGGHPRERHPCNIGDPTIADAVLDRLEMVLARELDAGLSELVKRDRIAIAMGNAEMNAAMGGVARRFGAGANRRIPAFLRTQRAREHARPSAEPGKRWHGLAAGEGKPWLRRCTSRTTSPAPPVRLRGCG